MSSQNCMRASWRAAVKITVGDGLPETISDSEDALNALTYRWPVTTGNHYQNARSFCAAALRGQVASEAAREVFIAASIEANMLAH